MRKSFPANIILKKHCLGNAYDLPVYGLMQVMLAPIFFRNNVKVQFLLANLCRKLVFASLSTFIRDFRVYLSVQAQCSVGLRQPRRSRANKLWIVDRTLAQVHFKLSTPITAIVYYRLVVKICICKTLGTWTYCVLE